MSDTTANDKYHAAVGEDGEYDIHRDGRHIGVINFYDDARRMMACLRAFMGVSTEDIEQGPLMLDVLTAKTSQILSLQREVEHWKANNENLAWRCAVLSQRDDLPVDRIPAYRELERLQEENARLKQAAGLVDGQS